MTDNSEVFYMYKNHGVRGGEVTVVSSGRKTGKSRFLQNIYDTMVSMSRDVRSLDRLMDNNEHSDFVAAYRFGVRTLTEDELRIVLCLTDYATWPPIPNRSVPRQDVEYLLKVGVVRETGKDKEAPKMEDRIFVKPGKLLRKCLNDWEVFRQI